MLVMVSIHVPARGTTKQIALYPVLLQVSIHVPARGTTVIIVFPRFNQLFQSTFPQGERLLHVPLPTLQARFNPRSRKGNDVPALCYATCVVNVSIHVPARGTTKIIIKIYADIRFQSTFPQGERQQEVYNKTPVKCFNPRSRKGNDYIALTVDCNNASFNPRSRKGNDNTSPWREGLRWCFNPRSRKGNDLEEEKGQLQNSFNPRSRKGNDTTVSCLEPICICFNPRSRKGNDVFIYNLFDEVTVSIHVPARGTTFFS